MGASAEHWEFWGHLRPWQTGTSERRSHRGGSTSGWGGRAHKAPCSACCVTPGSCPTSLNFQTLEAEMTHSQTSNRLQAEVLLLLRRYLAPSCPPCFGHKEPTVSPNSTAHLGHSGCQYIQQSTGISHSPVAHRCTSHVHSCKLRETQEQVELQSHPGTYKNITSSPIVYLECRNNLGNAEPWYRIAGKGGSPERAR